MYKQLFFYNSNFFIPNKSTSLFRRMFLEEISAKMTLVQSHDRLGWEHPFFAFPDSSSPPLELGNELFNQPASSVIIFSATFTIYKCTKENL